MTCHKLLTDGRVRELYKATGGAWGGMKVDEAFVNYFCEIFSEEVIEKVKQDYADDWVEMMVEFEKLKRKISLNNKKEFVHMNLRHCVHEVFLDVMDVNLDIAFKNNFAKTRGAILNRQKLKIPKIVIADMIEQVAKSISSHTTLLLSQKENSNLDFIVMVGGFSNSPIVIQEIKDQVSIPVIVPENAELSVVQGAIMFGWKPEMFQSRKSKRTYGIGCNKRFRENIDPEHLAMFDDDNVKRCSGCFDKLVTVNEDVEFDQTVKCIQGVNYHNQTYATIKVYESEESDVTYTNEPGTRKLGFITVPMPDTTGGMKRRVEIIVRFGGTEILVTGKDLTTGADVKAVYDFL